MIAAAPRAELTEIIWTIITGATFAFQVWAVYDSYLDRHWLRQAKIENGARIVAEGGFRRDVIRLFAQALLFTVGIISLVSTRGTVRTEEQPGRTLSLVLFLLFALLLLSLAVFDRIDRHRLINYHTNRRRPKRHEKEE